MSEAIGASSYVLYDERGTLVDPIDSDVREILTEHQEYISAKRQAIDLLTIESPDWFLEAEQSARKFLSSIGITALADVRLIGESENLPLLGFEQSSPMIAHVDPHTGQVVIRESRLADAQSNKGVFAAKTLVHELFHADVLEPDLRALRLKGDLIRLCHRSGLIHEGVKGVQGEMYEEGFATLVHGWYERWRLDETAPAIGIMGEPSHELPWYLAPPDAGMVSGPDGYVMELIAWGLERRGVMSSREFVDFGLATRGDGPGALPLRGFARAINTLKPGLYKQLRELEYGRENWLMAQKLVHGIVMEEQQVRAA